MKHTFRQTPLFTFLLYANSHGLEKKVLDCGAGGDLPPLAIFKEYGYETYGVEIDDQQIKRVEKFQEENNLTLNITKGDMRNLPFKEETFSYIFSFNSVFHMSKQEIRESVNEIKRVLKPGGLAFINFASTDDMRSGEGEKVGPNEYLQEERGEQVLHSYHDRNEAENYFDGFEIIYKETRIREGLRRDGGKIVLGYIDYIIEKKK